MCVQVYRWRKCECMEHALSPSFILFNVPKCNCKFYFVNTIYYISIYLYVPCRVCLEISFSLNWISNEWCKYFGLFLQFYVLALLLAYYYYCNQIQTYWRTPLLSLWIKSIYSILWFRLKTCIIFHKSTDIKFSSYFYFPHLKAFE